MSLQSRADGAVERAERFCRLGIWACTLGGVVFFLGLTTTGLLPQTSPRSTTSVYFALEGTGYMRWLSVPMMAVGSGLVVVGVVLLALGKRKSKGA